MPIQIRCQCGKALKVPDSAVGKAVKCPGCSKTIKVPAASASPKQPNAASAAKSDAASTGGQAGLEDLFDEEGFSSTVESLCPACRSEMAAAAVLCTKCGFNRETGTKLAAHKTAGVDIDHGTLALQRAEDHMVSEKAMQDKLIAGGGMPWWALALVLFMISSGLIIAVLVVNASRRVDAAAPTNPVALFLVLCGVGFYAISQGAVIMLIVHAFKQDIVKGLLAMFVPFYLLYHVFRNWRETWKLFVTSMLAGSVAGGFIGAAISQGGL